MSKLTYDQLYQANRFYWMEKRRLIPDHWTDEDILKVFHVHFKRNWNNDNAQFQEDGFEEAWSEKMSRFWNNLPT